MSAETNGESPVAEKKDTGYLLVVSVLLLTIVVTLGVLWQRERRGRMSAEMKLTDLRKSMIMDQLWAGQETMLPPLFPPSAGEEEVRPVQREDLISETTTIKGRPVRVLYISPVAGERFGFQEGDVVVVGALPTTMPAGGAGEK